MPSFLYSNGTFFNPASIPPVVSTPVTGGTVTMTGASPLVYLTPAGTLATLTIKLPGSPKPGQTARIVSTQIVTTLTVQTATGGAVAGAPTALVANTEVLMMWVGAPTSAWVWVR